MRDNVGLAPNNSLFTIVGVIGPICFSLLFKNLRVYDKPNIKAYILLLSFLVLTFTYFLLRDRYTAVKESAEYFTFLVVVIIMIALAFIRDANLNENFIRIGLLISILGCVLLLYGVANDPKFEVGQRATLKFGDDPNAQGNPHIYGKNGFLAAIFCLLALKYKEKVKFGILAPLAMFVLAMVSLFMTQSMNSVISFVFFLFLYAYFNFKFSRIYFGFIPFVKKWYVILAICGTSYYVYKLYDNNRQYVEVFNQIFTRRFGNLFVTFTGDKTGSRKNNEADESATGRINTVVKVLGFYDKEFKNGKQRYLVFGHGYKAKYIDIPHFEVYDSYGIFGFILYTYLFCYLVYCCYMFLRNPTDMVGEFICYGFLYVFFHNFTGGLVIDYNRLILYIVVARFIRFQSSTPAVQTA
ncbi:MAG: hypothetical protein ACRCVT_03440 [Leadbetterella sp.]